MTGPAANRSSRAQAAATRDYPVQERADRIVAVTIAPDHAFIAFDAAQRQQRLRLFDGAGDAKGGIIGAAAGPPAHRSDFHHDLKRPAGRSSAAKRSASWRTPSIEVDKAVEVEGGIAGQFGGDIVDGLTADELVGEDDAADADLARATRTC